MCEEGCVGGEGRLCEEGYVGGGGRRECVRRGVLGVRGVCEEGCVRGEGSV